MLRGRVAAGTSRPPADRPGDEAAPGHAAGDGHQSIACRHAAAGADLVVRDLHTPRGVRAWTA